MEATLQQNYRERWSQDHAEFSPITIHESESLIDPNWHNQPMRPWSEVYEELCREVGRVYGLNDIREA